jgi:hypothetical protein
MNIIEMDKQATYDLKDEFGNWIGHGFDKEKFAELVAAHEREECAKICEKQASELYASRDTVDCAEYLANAIRARSKL